MAPLHPHRDDSKGINIGHYSHSTAYKAPAVPPHIDRLSDAELVKLYDHSPQVHPDYSVHRLSPGTNAKPSEDRTEDTPVCFEANALDIVFTATTIPVPRVGRVARGEWDFLIAMDYIDGPLLAQVWPTLSIWRKLCVAFTLRRYIRQPRCFTQAPAGAPRICESSVFGDVVPCRGPFASYAQMTAFFSERYHMSLDLHNVTKDRPARKDLFDDSEPLVLCLQDLNLRNITVGEGGRLWLIDWGWSGYYLHASSM
ncbi:hypothetical protein BN946_scf184909.g52 [Trametes cinnabarina]|uniref:Aminoglycoside phosphotransferase domain-containing protein n=1 Tax=Pycnoporus cinnabarinus TaxID=5643 RepID=A0A060SGC1_PYCCI|nr:hypothetical protein BN946_scf184909.g52 [Trametes cinnabarina]